MQINSVSGISQAVSGTASSTGATGSASGSFTDALNDALNDVISAEQDSSQCTLQVLSGDDAGLETAMITAQKAELTLDLAIQVRNKVLDAYNEIIKMQL